ncbi:immunoglobulin superfamily member 10 [Rhinophrynus dorsalis]
MKPIGRSHQCLLGFLMIIYLASLPNSSTACPKPCACYVPAEVHCTFRYLTAIPRQIQENVERINLGYNSLNRLTETDFSGLKKLELLMLHSNEIQDIHESTFNDLSSLQVLKMSYNKVKTLHKNTFHGLKNMVRLHIDHNKLEFLNPESFYGLTSLKLVHLEGNLLRQLHTDTFVTLRYIQIFKTSSIKHIYLSDNQLSSLPKEMFLYMNELEGIYLHGNPWSCDCNLQWLTEGTRQTRDIIKCKRDRAGQQCPVCATPRKNKDTSLNEISFQQLACIKPTIENIFKIKNVTTPEEGSFTVVSAKDFVAPIGSLILNMTDQSGNEANLACSVQRPTKMDQITMDTKADYTIMRTTFSSFLICNIDYDHIQKLWGILAMYSDSPMTLKRDLLLTKTPFISYKYRQSVSDDDVFTDIEAEFRAEPTWLMQDVVTLQLDRTATTLSTLHIRYLVDVYVTLPNVPEKPLKTNWVMIHKSNLTKTEYSAVIGGIVEMNCDVVGEPTPAIEWVLPDGSKIRAPYVSEEGRIVITKNGKFILKAADSFDSGVYHCIATNYIDADVLSFRITVVSADVEEENVNGAELSVSNGEELYLPCGSTGVPDASVSWILPDHSVLYESSRNNIIFTNGTLKIKELTQRDRGYFRCLAANQYGLDILTHKVLVNEKKINVIVKKTQLDNESENDEGSGNDNNEEKDNQTVMGKPIIQKKIPVQTQSGNISHKLNRKLHRNIGIQRRNNINRRLRGQRQRQFTPSNRRIDPQRWREILEKTKQSSINTRIDTQVIESSVKEENVEPSSGEVEASSGEELLPVKENFLILTTKQSSLPTLNVLPTANVVNNSITSSIWTKTETHTPNVHEAEQKTFGIQKTDSVITVTSPATTISGDMTSPANHPNSNHQFETTTRTSLQNIREQPTTLSLLNNTSIELITKPPTASSVTYSTSKDLTTNSVLEHMPTVSHVKQQSITNEVTTVFNSLTATPQTVITNPSTTSSYPYTALQDVITASPTTSSYLPAASQHGNQDPTTMPNYLHVTIQDVIIPIPSTTSNYLNIPSQKVMTTPPVEFINANSSDQNIVIHPTPNDLVLTHQNILPNQPTTSSYLPVTSQNIIRKPPLFQKSKNIPTTYSVFNSMSTEFITKAPVTHKDTNTPASHNHSSKAYISKSQITDEIPNFRKKGIAEQTNIVSSLQNTNDSYEFSQPEVITQGETDLPLTTSKHSRENVLYSQERFSVQSNKNNEKLPYFSNTKDEDANVVAIDSSTKSSAKLFLSQSEIGPIYFHSTQKIVSPHLPAGSTIITHQQIQIVKEVTPFLPTVRRYGRRRIPGRRRIIRPDRIPNIKAHKYKYGKTDLRDYTQDIIDTSTISEFSKQKHIIYSTFPSSTSVPLFTEHASTTFPPNPYEKETSSQLIRTVENEDTTSSNNYISSTQSPFQVKINASANYRSSPDSHKSDFTHKQNMTMQIPTTMPTFEKVEYASSTSTQSIIKSRVASKILRRKIPFHRLFGNHQKEILRKLRKNTQLASTITKATPAMILSSTISKMSTTPKPTPSSILMSTTVISTTNNPMRQIESTIKPPIYLTDIIYPITSQYTTVIPNISLLPATTTASYITADKAARHKFMKRKRPRKKTTFSNSVYLNTWKTSSKTNMSNVTQTLQKPLFLKTSTTSPQEENTKSHSTTQPPGILFTTGIYAQTTPVSSASNEILTTIKHMWSKMTNPPKPPMKQLPKKAPKTISTTHTGSSEKNSVTTYGQAVTEDSYFKDTLVINQKNSKPSSSSESEMFTSTFAPILVTHKGIISESKPSPIPTKRTAQPQNKLMKKTVITNLENRSKVKTSGVTERSTSNIENSTNVLKDSAKDNHFSITTQQYDNKIGSEWSAALETTTISRQSTEPFLKNSRRRPRIIGGKAASFTVLANSDAFLPCEAIGNPAPTILWTKVSSGTFISKTRRGSKMEVFTNGTLSIPSVSIQDHGQYLCVANNQYGSDRLLVTLSVITYPPRILQGRSTEITVHSGNSVNVQCQAEGRPYPTITWILANETIASETSMNNYRVFVQSDGTLTIKAVTIYDRGIYKCLATNLAGSDSYTVRIQVISAPPIILEDKRQTVLAVPGETLKIPCTAKGNPHPGVHWVVFDGTKVKPLQYVNAKLFLFSNGTLYIRNVASTDSGNYECIATSSTGSERRVVNLMVQKSDTIPKIVHASPKTTEMNFGDRLMLNCTATGEPKPKIIWRLPSKAVVDQWHRMGSRIQVYPNGSLIVESVNEKDAGDYLCVARNKMGDDLILMKVSVTMKPAKIVHKQHLTKQVPYGKDFKVDCKASGSPLPEISWSLPDGTMINNVLQADDSGRRTRRYILFDNGTLYLNKVGIAEEGDYTCYAQNTLGKDEMKVHISVVTAAPRIKINLKTKYETKAGESALLNCDAIGEPKPKIFWLLPSSDMIATSHDRYLLHENGSLSISQVKLLDAGEYMCVARNPAGDDTKLLKLDVHSKPPLINGLYSNKTIIKETAIKHSRKLINCRAEDTSPVQIMWIMPDNIYLTAPYHGSRIMVHKNGTLEIRNVRPTDTAEFTCVARNDGGESMLVVQLEVLDMLRRPMFKNPFNEKIIAKPGKMAILNCLAEGNPAPEIIWLLPNGTRFLNGQKFSKYHAGINGTFIIYSPTKEDAGKYRCAARNKVGYIEKLIILEVGQKPNILTHPKGPIKNIIGEALSLHCLSDGIPKPTIIWTLPSGYIIDRPHVNGKYMLLENGTLVIQETTIHDRGNYLCKAKNNAGEASISVPVMVVAYPPRITNKPPQNIHTRVGSAVHLNCIAIGIPKPEITWELPDFSILSTASKGRPSGTELLHPQGTLVVQNPQRSDSGIYKCIAKNPLGTDISRTYLKVI